MRIGITFGVWDLFHEGHLRFLERACEMVDELYVGVASDDFTKKSKCETVMTELERERMVLGMSDVVGTFVYDSPDYSYWYDDYEANVLVVSEDFGKTKPQQKILKEADIVVVLKRTPDISTTEIKERVCRLAKG